MFVSFSILRSLHSTVFLTRPRDSCTSLRMSHACLDIVARFTWLSYPCVKLKFLMSTPLNHFSSTSSAFVISLTTVPSTYSYKSLTPTHFLFGFSTFRSSLLSVFQYSWNQLSLSFSIVLFLGYLFDSQLYVNRTVLLNLRSSLIVTWTHLSEWEYKYDWWRVESNNDQEFATPSIR